MTHAVTLKPAPFNPLGRRATPTCTQCGPLTPDHVDIDSARDMRAAHLAKVAVSG